MKPRNSLPCNRGRPSRKGFDPNKTTPCRPAGAKVWYSVPRITGVIQIYPLQATKHSWGRDAKGISHTQGPLGSLDVSNQVASTVGEAVRGRSAPGQTNPLVALRGGAGVPKSPRVCRLGGDISGSWRCPHDGSSGAPSTRTSPGTRAALATPEVERHRGIPW